MTRPALPDLTVAEAIVRAFERASPFDPVVVLRPEGWIHELAKREQAEQRKPK